MAASAMSLPPPTLPPSPPVFLPPPGTNFIATVKPSLTFVIIGTTFSSMLIPLLVALLYFSTPQTREMPVLWMNIASVVAGIGLGAWNNYMEVHAILSPLEPLAQPVYLSFNAIYSLLPVLVETILMMRLLVFFPPKYTPRLKLAMVFAFPVSVKIIRIVIQALYTRQWAEDTKHIGNPVVAAIQSWSRTPYIKTDWFLQMFDNTYSSGMFLWNLRNSQATPANHVRTTQSLAYRLKMLFWIALSNFMFPVMFNIVQLVIVFRNPDFLLGVYVVMANTYISIIGVVFATVWAGSHRMKESTHQAGANLQKESLPSWRNDPQGELSSTSTAAIRLTQSFSGYDVDSAAKKGPL